MARDGTNRGGRRVRAGSKPEPLADRLADGRTGRILSVDDPPEPYDFTGSDTDEGALLSGVEMPEPSAYLAAQQRDGSPLGADEIYRETWEWLADKGCTQFVSKRLLEAYAQSFARFIQCEKAISDFGLPGKHPTTGAAIASPFVAMSQSFQKQANVLWYEIFDIVKANCTTDYTPLPSDPMERLLQSR